jgi:hypothetical protein
MPFVAVTMSPRMSTTASCGLEGRHISMLRTSRAKARGVDSGSLSFETLMTTITSFIISGSSPKLLTERSKTLIFSFLAAGQALSRVILTVSDGILARRRLISVAKRVHRILLLGKGIPVSASRIDLFPADWSPQITNCGSGSVPFRPHFPICTTMSSRRRCSSVYSSSSDEVVSISFMLTGVETPGGVSSSSNLMLLL